MKKKIISFALLFSMFLTSCGLFGGGGNEYPDGHDPHDPHYPGEGGDSQDGPQVPEEGWEEERESYISYIPCEGIDVTFDKMKGQLGEEIGIHYEIKDFSKKYEIKLVSQHTYYTVNDGYEPEEHIYIMLMPGKNIVHVTEFTRTDVHDEIASKRGDYINSPYGDGKFMNNIYLYSDTTFEKDTVGIAKYGLRVFENKGWNDRVVIIPESVKYCESEAIGVENDTTLFMEHDAKPAGFKDDYIWGDCLVLWGCKDPNVRTYTFQNTELKYIYYENNASVAIVRGNNSKDQEITVPSKIDNKPVKAICGDAFNDLDSNIHIPSSVELIGGEALSQGRYNERHTITIDGTDLKPGFNESFTNNMKIVFNDPSITRVKETYLGIDYHLLVIKKGSEEYAYIRQMDLVNENTNHMHIPAVIGGYQIKGILYSMDSYHEFGTISMPDCLTSIYPGAFGDVNCLVFEMGNGVTYLGSNALPEAREIVWNDKVNYLPSHSLYRFNGKITNIENITTLNAFAIESCKVGYEFSNVTHVKNRAIYQSGVLDVFTNKVKYDYCAYQESSLPYFNFDKDVLNDSMAIFNCCKFYILNLNNDFEMFQKFDAANSAVKLILNTPQAVKYVETLEFDYENKVSYVKGKDFNDSITQDGLYYIAFNGENFATLMAAPTCSKIIRIPDSVLINNKDYKVEVIGEECFTNRDDEIVVFGKNITSVLSKAFFKNKASFILNTGLTYIGNSAFGLEEDNEHELVIPKTVKYIGYHALIGRNIVYFEADKLPRCDEEFILPNAIVEFNHKLPTETWEGGK